MGNSRAAMPNSEEGSVVAVCLAALTAMLRARGLMFSMLARASLEPADVETKIVDLLLAAVKDLCSLPR